MQAARLPLHFRVRAHGKQMAALELGERVPVSIEQSREDFRLHFAFLQLFIALFVARVVLAIGINRRHEQDVITVGRPDPAVGAGRDIRSDAVCL